MNTIDWIKSMEKQNNFGIIVDTTLLWLTIFDILGSFKKTFIITNKNYDVNKYPNLIFVKNSEEIKTNSKKRVVYDVNILNTIPSNNSWIHSSNVIDNLLYNTRIIEDNVKIQRIGYNETNLEKLINKNKFNLGISLYLQSKKHVKYKYKICNLCLHQMKNRTQLQCGHEFCFNCIINKEICPLCDEPINSKIFPEKYINSRIKKTFEFNNCIIYSLKRSLRKINKLIHHPKYGNPNDIKNILLFDEDLKYLHKYNICNNTPKLVYVFDDI